MSERAKAWVLCAMVGAAIVFIILSGIFITDKEVSVSERRKLTQLPKINIERVLDGRYMNEFESYCQDQFPFREVFRKVKAITAINLFQQKDNNGIYAVNGNASSIDGKLNVSSIEYAANRFKYIVDKYDIQEENIFVSIIPDKNYFLAKINGYPYIDYEKLESLLLDELNSFTYIDIMDTLNLEDYYMTDSHWKQECIIDTANVLKVNLNSSKNSLYQVNEISRPFYGVYYGQLSLNLKPDKIRYLTNNTINNLKACLYDGNVIPVYDAYTDSDDLYDSFLDGPEPIVIIENAFAENDKELIVFRDSFGSSIAPLLAEGYKKVTLIDIRYIRSDTLSQFIDFEDSQVLFLYSTAVLNNSVTLK